MKHIILLILFIVGITSCVDNSIQKEYIPKKEITFNTNNYTVDTRAAVSDAGLTDLYVVENGIILAHQVSTQSTFGKPTLSLEYGTHTLTFIATKSTDPNISNNIFSCTKVLDTFSKTETITISSSSPTSQEITLERIVYGLSIAPKDVFPDDIYDLEVVIQDHSLTYNISTGFGTSTEYKRVFDLSSLANQSTDLSYTIYGFMPSNTDNIDITLNFRREDESIIVSREVNDLPIKLNQKTYLTGYFFDSSSSLSLKVNSQWLDNNTIDYNNR